MPISPAMVENEARFVRDVYAEAVFSFERS